MIHIIKQGDLKLAESKNNKTKFFSCPMCECEFSADKEDYNQTITVYMEDSISCKCPCCGSKVTMFY